MRSEFLQQFDKGTQGNTESVGPWESVPNSLWVPIRPAQRLRVQRPISRGQQRASVTEIEPLKVFFVNFFNPVCILEKQE